MASDPDPMTAVSERYCSHMNKDHADAVLYYVQYFSSRPDARSARLLSIDSSGMDLSFSTNRGSRERCRVTIKPKLKDPGDGRQRLIEMMNEAIEGLGLSRHAVDKWEAPDFASWLLILLVTFQYFLLLTPPSTLHHLFPPLHTLRTSLPLWFQQALLIFVPLAHLFEAHFLLGPRLRKYRVPEGVGWKWWGSVMLVGGPAIRHFGIMARREVGRKEREEEAKKASGKAH